MATPNDPSGISERQQLMTTFCVGLASFTVLVWDHLLTFSDEVRYIWKQKKGPLIWLFFLNRYLTPLGFIVNLFAYFSDFWTPEHFVRYEGAMTVIGINTASLMMLLRVWAMYGRKKGVVTFLALIFVLELGTNAWLLSTGTPVPHSASIHTCTMFFDPTKSPRAIAAASAWLPLLYDTTVLALTFWRTFSGIRRPTIGRTMKVLLKEGIVYYSVIFCVTLVLTLMIAFAPPGLQNVCAQTEYLMSVAMMSRITLHLKRKAHHHYDASEAETTYDLTTSTSRYGSPIQFAHRRSAIAGSPMVISVQEYSVTHDDRGKEVARPEKSLGHDKRTSWTGQEEWFEFAPLRLDLSTNFDGMHMV